MKMTETDQVKVILTSTSFFALYGFVPDDSLGSLLSRLITYGLTGCLIGVILVFALEDR